MLLSLFTNSILADTTYLQPDTNSISNLTALTTSQETLVKASNSFSMKLFQEVSKRKNPNKNIIISPLSIMYALCIIYNGADGDTRKVIANTLEIDDIPYEEINKSFRNLMTMLIEADTSVKFMNANSIWVRKNKTIQPNFISLCKNYFDAHIQEIDFLEPWAADTINHWVNNRTNGRIAKIVESSFDVNTIAILLNALYFRADWRFPFDTSHTRTQPFYRADSTQTECEMMFLREDDHVMKTNDWRVAPDTSATYYSNELFQAVNLPYGIEGFRMTVLVPDSSSNVDNIIKELTLENWTNWLNKFRPERFTIGLPKFQLECELNINEELKALGMDILFDQSRCDFGNMFVDKVGYLSQIAQKTFIKVDERGTELAVVTQSIFMDSIPPFILADRPFLIVIHDSKSGAIFFIGKISDPVWND